MTRVLLFGDSNTHGTPAMTEPGERRRFGAEVRWPDRAAAALGPGWELIPEGHPGRTTVHPDPIEGEHKNGAAVLPALLESHFPLDVVAVMLGTNDLKHRFAATAADIALGIERLVDIVVGSGTGPEGSAPALLVIAPPQVVEAGVLAEIFSGATATSQSLGPTIAAMAQRRGAAFLDAGGVVAPDPVDGVHLDMSAHAALASAVADALRRLPLTRAT